MKVKNSKRLCFTLMTSDDADLLFQLDQSTNVMKYINGGQKTSLAEVHSVYLPRMMSYQNPKEGWGLWKVCLIENQEFIGWVLVRPMNFFSESPELDNLEMGWRFFEKHWGRGLATEAALTIKNALIENCRINKLSAIAIEGNLASIGVMKKLGMRYLKTDIHRDPLGDQQVVFYQLSVNT